MVFLLHARIVCGLIATALLIVVTSGSARAEEAQELFDAAMARSETLSPEESIALFEQVTAADFGFAPAHYQIGLLHMSLTNPEDRLRAERALTRAIKLSPDNLQYRMAFGDLLWMQGKWEASAHWFSELYEADPNNARAAYQVGYRALKEFLKYKDMEDYESGVRFTWDHFAVKDRDMAVDYLARSVKLDPSFQDAYYQLGLIYYESDEYGKLIEISKALLGQDPEAKDAYLFGGLGYQMVNDQEKAFEYYSNAIERMSPEERALMESVENVASDDDLTAIGESSADGASAVVEAFWRRQDPLFLTDYNERKMEHYGRVAYANLHYSRPSKGLSGWQTDKGMTHIRFGRSLHRRVQRPEVSMSSGALVQAHEERWFYEGMVVTFQNWDGLDGWRFRKTQRPGETPTPTPMDVESRYVDPYRWQKYALPHTMAAFREAGRTRLELAYMVPKDRIDPVEPEMQAGIFMFDDGWEPVSRDIIDGPKLVSAGDDSIRQNYLLMQQTLYVEPSSYNIVVEVRDRIEDSIGSFHEHRQFEGEGDGLGVSDLLLASTIETEDPFPDRRDQLKIVPNPIRTYLRSESVFVYLEVYDLTRDEFGRTAYDVSYRVGWPKGISELDPGLFAAIDMVDREAYLEVEEMGAGGTLRQDGQDAVADYQVNFVLPERNRMVRELEKQIEQGKGVETVVTARYEGDREDDLTYLQIDVSQVPPGVHELSIEVTDVHGEVSRTRKALFKVVE